MSKVTNSARGEDCTIRIPGYCADSNETVVACHYSLAGFSGKGFKSPDAMSAYGCVTCHAIVDGHMNVGEFDRTEIRLMHAEGVFRTQARLIDKGLMVVK